jgi:predicted RNase H-like HicB family nuclease
MSIVRYSVVLEWDEEEQLFVASVPALSVSTYGETRDEALANAREAIAVTLDGLQATGQPRQLF